jgi:hypothetical protein
MGASEKELGQLLCRLRVAEQVKGGGKCMLPPKDYRKLESSATSHSTRILALVNCSAIGCCCPTAA